MTACARIRRAAAAGAICAGLAAALTGCIGSEDPDAGTNGVGRLPAAEIESKALRAAEAAESVQLSGKVVSKGRVYRLDMRLNADGGVGEVVTEDNTFELLRVGKNLYLKADADFWLNQEGDPAGDAADAADAPKTDRDARAAAEKLDGKYVKVPPGDPAYQQLTGFTTMEVMLDGLLTLQGERETGDRGEIGGRRTIQVTADDGRGGVIDVSLIGTPYPLRMVRAGGAGTLHLAEWDKAFPLSAPDKEQVVDYGKQILPDG